MFNEDVRVTLRRKNCATWARGDILLSRLVSVDQPGKLGKMTKREIITRAEASFQPIKIINRDFNPKGKPMRVHQLESCIPSNVGSIFIHMRFPAYASHQLSMIYSLRSVFCADYLLFRALIIRDQRFFPAEDLETHGRSNRLGMCEISVA